MSERPAAKRVAIIGMGLIGGSLARVLQAHSDVGHVAGCVETDADAALARELGLADSVTTNPLEAAAGADIVVLAVGIDAMGPVCARLGGALGPDTVVTDVGSTKAGVIADVRSQLGDHVMTRFVPGHPIAGTENSGLRAGFQGLFAGRRAILTPLDETDPAALARVEQLWRAAGAHVSLMDPAHHDQVLAATSHLPHLLAFALVDTLAAMAERTEIFEYAAGGFADFTRIASSDPALWTRIMFANRREIMPVLDQYIIKLNDLRDSLENQDESTVRQSFTRAKDARDRFTERLDTSGQA